MLPAPGSSILRVCLPLPSVNDKLPPDANILPPVASPLTNIVPLTSSFPSGLLVPMPRRPFEVIRTFSVSPGANPKCLLLVFVPTKATPVDAVPDVRKIPRSASLESLNMSLKSPAIDPST